MKITRSDADRLVIVDFPWVMGLILILLPCGMLAQLAVGHTHPASSKDVVFPIIVSLLFLGCGLYVNQRTVVSLDRARREVEWSRTGLFWRKGGIVSFDQIHAAQVTSVTDNRGRMDFRAALILKDRSEIPLMNMYWSGTRVTYGKICDAINAFMGKADVTPQFDLDSEIRQLVSRGLVIQAISLVRQTRGSSLVEAKDYVESLK